MDLVLKQSIMITLSTTDVTLPIDVILNAALKTRECMNWNPLCWIYKLFHNIFGKTSDRYNLACIIQIVRQSNSLISLSLRSCPYVD